MKNNTYRSRQKNNRPHTNTSSLTNSNGKKYTVPESSELLAFLLKTLAGQSQTSVKNLLKHRCILVNDQCVSQYNYILQPNDCVTVVSSHQKQFGLNHPKLRLLFEDDFILVVDKASGLHSVDTTGHGVENAASILDGYIRRKSPGKRIYIVHRLDRDTSGVMLFAKSREAQDVLVADWNERVLERTYIALAEGDMAPLMGTIDSWLYEDERKVMHSTSDAGKGLRAITHYQVIEKGNGYTLVRLNLETGRTNQIRVHLQSLGFPVAGDGKYGAKTDPVQRLALHAMNIRFRHPFTQKVLAFSVDMPESFRQVMRPGADGLDGV